MKTAARGYDGAHKRRRKAAARLVKTGTLRCARGAACKFAETVNGERVGGRIMPGQRWDLGHDDGDRSRYTGPEHMECNRATNGRNGTRSRPAERHPGLI